MCGRYAFKAKISELTQLTNIENSIEFNSLDNIAPTMQAPIIIHNRIGMAEWGLIPAWADYTKFKGKLFNARSETLHEKPSFKESWQRKRRCIVPATHFYEWNTHDKGQKGRTPYIVSLSNTPILGFAGLWSKTANGVSYTIITKDAVSPIKDIHPRMPVMLTPDMFEKWFRADHSDAADLCANPQTDNFISAQEGNSDLNKVAVF